MNEKSILISIIVLIVIILLVLLVCKFVIGKNEPIKDEPKKDDNVPFSNEIDVVPTMNDKISSDTGWCATFQLVWNDMKNEVVKQDITMTPQPEIVDNLNKESFTENMLSDEYYYKVYGPRTLALKEQIEKGIKEKFDQTSDILDEFDWSDESLDSNNIENYIFYTMLYRKFEYLYEFDKLENGKFGKYENVEYFGIDKDSDNKLRENVRELYYNSEDDFAIILTTKNNDEVIMVKNPEGETFNQIYENMNKKAEKQQEKFITNNDYFKAPVLKFNVKKEFIELENKPFTTADGKSIAIEKAIQTVKFEINEKGGEVKSEAAIGLKYAAEVRPVESEPKYYYLDDTFALFLREEGSNTPYFAARIEDINKYK